MVGQRESRLSYTTQKVGADSMLPGANEKTKVYKSVFGMHTEIVCVLSYRSGHLSHRSIHEARSLCTLCIRAEELVKKKRNGSSLIQSCQQHNAVKIHLIQIFLIHNLFNFCHYVAYER